MPQASLARLARHFELIPVCPESMGGLPTPRPPAEIVGGSGAQVLVSSASVRAWNESEIDALIRAAGAVAKALAKAVDAVRNRR